MKHTYIIVNDIITLCTPEPHCITPDHPHYDYIREALENELDEDLSPFINPKKAVITWAQNQPTFRIEEEVIFYKDRQIDLFTTSKILNLLKAKKPVTRLLRFLDRLSNNPSHRAREQLYAFMERGKMPIQEDGTILAYKKLNSDWTDMHTGNISHKLNEPVSMDRADVDDDPAHACAPGLHVCSFNYLQSFEGSILITTEVDPEHVVCIPHDHDCEKMRVCKHTPRFEIPIYTAKHIWENNPFPTE